jgi:hypothetical protein
MLVQQFFITSFYNFFSLYCSLAHYYYGAIPNEKFCINFIIIVQQKSIFGVYITLVACSVMSFFITAAYMINLPH